MSIGGGALISGVAVAIKALPDVRIWGVETEGADAMARALAAGEPVDIAPSSIASTRQRAARFPAHARPRPRAGRGGVRGADAEAARGMVAFAEEAKTWVDAGDRRLVTAARQVIERARDDVSLGFVARGNVARRDVRGWFDRLLSTAALSRSDGAYRPGRGVA